MHTARSASVSYVRNGTGLSFFLFDVSSNALQRRTLRHDATPCARCYNSLSQDKVAHQVLSGLLTQRNSRKYWHFPLAKATVGIDWVICGSARVRWSKIQPTKRLNRLVCCENCWALDSVTQALLGARTWLLHGILVSLLVLYVEVCCQSWISNNQADFKKSLFFVRGCWTPGSFIFT